MKKLIPFALAGFVIGCAEVRPIQADVTNVHLVKVDTVQRYPNSAEQVLTWRSADHIDYVTFEPLTVYYPIGTTMKVLVKR